MALVFAKCYQQFCSRYSLTGIFLILFVAFITTRVQRRVRNEIDSVQPFQVLSLSVSRYTTYYKVVQHYHFRVFCLQFRTVIARIRKNI